MILTVVFKGKRKEKQYTINTFELNSGFLLIYLKDDKAVIGFNSDIIEYFCVENYEAEKKKEVIKNARI